MNLCHSKYPPMPFRLPAAAVFLCLCLFSSEAAMSRITSRDTPAHRAALKFMRGVNVGNYLEYAVGNGARNQTYTGTDFTQIKAEGFDHVRIPVAWHIGAGSTPTFTIQQTLFNQADNLVNLALARGLNVIIDLHHFEEFMQTPNTSKTKFYALWAQVADHYKAYPDSVAFELLNEPNGAATTPMLNSIYPEAIRQIRLTNPNRTIFLGPGQWNGIGELKRVSTDPGLELPNNDTNLIVTVHCYDPYYFTHQGAEWALPDSATVGVKFPGPPATPLEPHPSIEHQWVLDWFRDYNTRPTSGNPSSAATIQSRLQLARLWAEYWGRPVHVGEWGCYEKSDAVSRVAYHQAFRTVVDAQRLGWAMWDWKAGFHYWKNGAPEPAGMRAAIFPAPQLTLTANREVRAEAAIGKTYVVEKANPALRPLTWQPVSTQTLTTNIFLFQLEESDSAAMYRVFWRK